MSERVSAAEKNRRNAMMLFVCSSGPANKPTDHHHSLTITCAVRPEPKRANSLVVYIHADYCPRAVLGRHPDRLSGPLPDIDRPLDTNHYRQLSSFTSLSASKTTHPHNTINTLAAVAHSFSNIVCANAAKKSTIK